MGTNVTKAASTRTDTEADFAQRYCSNDGLVHDYLKRELADPDVIFLTPWCERGKLLPVKHLRRKVDNQPLSRHTTHQVCPPCGRERQEMRQGRPS